MLNTIKHILLTASVVMLTSLTVSCDKTVPINLDEYQVNLSLQYGNIITDGTLLEVPKVRVQVSHPEAAGRLIQVNAYAYGERLSYFVKEGETRIFDLDFEQFADREYNPDEETDVRITVVYGFDGSGGGLKIIYEENFLIEFRVVD